MAGAGFKTFTAGEVLTAANTNEYLMQQTMFTFANAAARAAQVTAPSEGMHCYLLDTNELQIYNGSNWVAVLPKSDAQANINQGFSGSYTTRTASVSITTGTSAYVTLMSPSMTIGGGSTVLLSFVVSGATSIAATDANAITSNTSSINGSSRLLVVTGLTPGVNVFTLASRASDNGAVINTPSITVQGVI
jgi:hypothetical protein